MEESFDVPSWSRNGGSSLPIFTDTNHETIDSPGPWEGSRSCSSQESDLMPINPLECYQTRDTLDASYADPEATSKFPSTVKFPGAARFHMLFDETDRNYSSELNKMFVTDNTNVPIKFAWDWQKNLVSCPKLRAVLLFQSVQMIDTVITICPVHRNAADKSDQDHVMRCGDDRAEYLEDLGTRRRSVLVPLGPPQTGANATTIILSFVCRNSCSEVKKNPTQIVFTLEDSLGQVLGRDVVLVQVSASPMRDKKNAERPSEPKSAKRRPSTSAVDDKCQKRVKPEMPEKDFTMVPVLDREHYEQVMLHAHGSLLVRIDREQRPATAQELQLLASYTNIPASPEAGPKNRTKKCSLSADL